jgi:hypothetical protein
MNGQSDELFKSVRKFESPMNEELIQEHFAESNDHIRKLEERIAKQRELIAERSAAGLSTEVEEKLLANFTKTLEAKDRTQVGLNS